MRNLNFLRKSERKSVGTTLALTVGSPSAHRRYSALKHLAFMLLFLLGSLNVWGETITYTFNSKSWGATSGGSAANWTSGQDGAGFNNNGIQVTTAASGANGTSPISFTNVTKVVCTYNTNASKGKGTIDVQVGTNDAKSVNWAYSGSASGTSANFTATVNYATAETGNVKITLNTSTNSIYLVSVTITTQSSNPEVNVSPASWDFGTVHASAEASKVFSVSGSNLIAGNLTLAVPDGFSVDPSSIAVDGTLAATNVTVSKSTSTEDDYVGNLSITGGGLASAKTVGLTMTVDADPEPTGTFNKYTGTTLPDGYYVICSGSTTTAMKNTALSGPRIGYATVDIVSNSITNPDESVIWKLENLTGDDAGYFTLYNEAVEKYAAFTSANGNANVITSVTDYAKFALEENSSFDFLNKGKTGKYLRLNGTYGFANYASSMGAALTLYKKQVAGQPATPEFSVAEGNYEEAQSVEISCATIGAKIYYTLDGSKPTSASAEYSTAIPVSATTTIKAVAIKDDIESTVASATYTIVVWQTVDEIWSSITSEGPTNANVWGYVSQANVGGYNNNYYISVDGSLTANQLEIYKGDNAGNTVAVGDKVHVNGDLTIFNEIKEFKQNTGVIVHYAAKGDLQSVAVSGTPTKTEYAANEDFDPAGLVVTGTYANGYVGVITEGITWGNDLTDNKVTETTTVHVTATVSGITNSPAHNVGVTVAAKTLESIAVGTASYTIYTGEILPKPVVTATFSEGDPEDVSAFAVYDSESVFDTEVIDDPDPQTITVSYTFGGETKTATYTVSVKDYANADDAPYTVTEALHIITAAIGNTESAREIVVAGTVSAEKVSNYKNRYKISDGVNELLVYNGKGFNEEAFTDNNYPKVGDVMVVKGNVINFNNNTPEFASGKSYPLSQIRPATIAIENVTSFEVGATDLTENDLDITTASDGDITFVSGDETKATIVADVAIHAVAPGAVTITANLAATENVAALNYAAAFTTFDVTVVAPATKYAITFDGNGNTGGSAPEAIADKAAGEEVTLPANSYTKTGHTFTGWKVYDENEDEVTVTANAFEMPASPVTIKAQWAEISIWATTYTSNLDLKGNSGTKSYAEKVKITVNEVLTEFDALRACTGSAAGSCTIKVPAGTQTLHFHAAAWNAKTSTITVTMGETELLVQALDADAGIKNSSPYTLEGIPYEYYYSIDLSSYSLTEETTITFSAGSDKRFVLFGVNQEGGVVPVLQSLAVSGDLENKTYEAGAAINPAGLTVMGTYTLGGTPQAPVDVTDQVEDWLYDALQAGDETVTISAKIGTVTSAGYEISGLTVTDPTPQIYVNKLNVNFGTVATNAGVDDQTITVTLTNVASVTASLGGTNPEAFNISPASLTESGDITISFIGSTATAASYAATVTISDGAEGAEDKMVNLSLSVEEVETPVSTTSQWVVATEVADGMEVLLTGVKSAITYALSAQGNNNRTADAGTLSEGVFTPGANTMSVTLEEQSTGKFALRTSNGKYLYAASSSANNLKTRDAIGDDGKAVWSISINGDNEASIVANCETASWRNTMQFNQNNSNAPVFNCYASASQSVIKIYVPKTVEPEWVDIRPGATSGKYYTVCLSKKVVDFRGGNFWSMSKRGDGIAYLEEATGILPAGTPYIFEVTGDKLEVVYEGDATDVAGTNGALHGTFEVMNQTALSEKATDLGSDIYLLSGNKLWNVTGTGASGNNLAAGRAYIVYKELVNETPQPAPGRRVRAIPMGQQTATGIDALNTSETPVKMIINGELFIIRGEKMYNANGQIVK